MKQLDVVMHDPEAKAGNPFEIEMDGPLLSQVTTVKRAPKLYAPGDLGGIGFVWGIDVA
jgi:hypothetical protein